MLGGSSPPSGNKNSRARPDTFEEFSVSSRGHDQIRTRHARNASGEGRVRRPLVPRRGGAAVDGSRGWVAGQHAERNSETSYQPSRDHPDGPAPEEVPGRRGSIRSG